MSAGNEEDGREGTEDDEISPKLRGGKDDDSDIEYEGYRIEFPSNDEEDPNPVRVEGNTEFKSGRDLGDHFYAATTAKGNTCSVEIGNLGSFEFNQKQDPNDYSLPDSHGNFKFVKPPFKRPENLPEKLVLYGYDIADAHEHTNGNNEHVAFVSLCAIMCDDYSTGNVLVTMGITRCDKRRLDGFVYNVREDR